LDLLNNPFETHCQSSSGPNIFCISAEYCPSASYMISGGPIFVPDRAPFIPTTIMSLAAASIWE
jgi:hypothetical protein